MSIKTSTLESIQSDLRKLVDPAKIKLRENLEYLESLIKDEVGVELPKELIEYFERYVPANKFMVNGLPDIWFDKSLDISESIEVRANLLEEDSKWKAENYDVYYDSKVTKRWFAPHWIPLFRDGDGDYLCYDIKPESGGKQGQLILYRHDEPERPIHGHFNDVIQARLNPPIRKVEDFERQAGVKIPSEVIDFYNSLYYDMVSGVLFYSNNARYDIIGVVDWSSDPAGTKEIFTKVEDGLKAITIAKLHIGTRQEIEYNIFYILDSNGYRDGEIHLFDKELNPIGKIANNFKEFFMYNEVVDTIASLTINKPITSNEDFSTSILNKLYKTIN